MPFFMRWVTVAYFPDSVVPDGEEVEDGKEIIEGNADACFAREGYKNCHPMTGRGMWEVGFPHPSACEYAREVSG